MMPIYEFDSLDPQKFLNRDIQAEADVSATPKLEAISDARRV